MKLKVKIFMIFFLVILSSMLIAEDEPLSAKFKIKFYGFVKLEAIYDNTEVAKGDWLLFVRPNDSPEAKQEVFTMNARHTRIGMDIQGPVIDKNGKIVSRIEFDFAGGFPNSSTAARQPQLRLRHAWVEVNFPSWEARFGQDWALIASPFPNTTSFVVGAGKGNLWMRYPQIRYTFKKDKIKFATSINRPMAGNIKYNDFDGGDFDPVADGERSGLPWLMGRMWYIQDDFTASLSAHYGKEKISDLLGNAHNKSSYSLNADVQLRAGSLKFIVRGFYGENLNSFFGGVFQGFTCDSSSVTNVASKGGWFQFLYKLNPSWSATLGGGMDDPDDNNLKTGNRSRNDWGFFNIAYNYKKPLIFILESEFLRTSYINGEEGENIRFQFVTYFKF